jgi:WD40 repeat protein
MPSTSINIALDRFTTFGDLLKYLRRRAGLTQRELSIAVSYSDTQISRLEQNERMPDLATLTARFLPALHLEDQPEVATRLLELAAAVRREDAPATGIPPYKGLHYFEENDAELFFGREGLTDLLVERLTERVESDQRILTIVGASGSGKSSLVRAGIIPALRWQQSSSGWPVYVTTPTAHPLEALAASLNRETRQGFPVRKLTNELSNSPESLQLALKRISEAAWVEHVLLVVDQFEELFTLCRSESEQSAFVNNLLKAAFQPGGPAVIVVVLRADFYAHCAHFDLLRRALSQHQEYIGPMTHEELRRAIEEPAHHGHWEFEAGLVDLLLHDVGADAGHIPEPGALPLLSHALLTTWQRRRGRMLTLSGYTASGGVRGAIAETAEAVFYDQLEPEQRIIARQIFLRLTELGGDASTADTRRRVYIEELVAKPDEKEMVQDVLLTLADSRLVTMDQNTAEVAHEALIREWPTLRGWLEEDRENLRLHRRLTEAAQEWGAMGRDLGELYRGARLAQAIEWATTHADDMNVLESSFLEASRSLAESETAEREAQRQRELDAARQLAETERGRAEEQLLSTHRLRQRAMLLSFALFFAGALAVIAFLFGQRALQAGRLATSRELAAAAVNNLQVDLERSVLLALQALEQADTLEARNALHQFLPELHILHTIAAHQQTPSVAFSPDGARIASIGFDGEVKVWDSSTYQLLLSIPGEPGSIGFSVAFSPDGNLLAAALNTQAVIYHAATGQKLFSLDGMLSGPATQVLYMSFSPDSKRLAVANMDGAPAVWDLDAQVRLFTLTGHQQICDGIAYSPDGKLLATSDEDGIVKVWDSATAQELFTFELSGNIHNVAFSPDGKRLAAASENGFLFVLDPTTGKELFRLFALSGLYDVAFMPDGRWLVTAGQDGTARIWDAATGMPLHNLAGNTSTVVGVAPSPDGKRIATAGYDGTLKMWDTLPGRELLTLVGQADEVWNVAYSTDGTQLGAVSLDGTGWLWDVATGKVVLKLTQGSNSGDGLTTLAFHPDGKRLAAGSASGLVTIWNLETGQVEMILKGHTNLIYGLAFSPDGSLLATSSWDGTVRLWDLIAGKEVPTFHSDQVQPGPGSLNDIAFSPDGKRLFTVGAGGIVHMLDSATGQLLQEFDEGGLDIYGVAISPDGKLLATGRQDGAVTVWNITSGQKLLTMVGHASLVARVAFNRDGSYLASAGFDNLARVWNVKTGQELATLYLAQMELTWLLRERMGAYEPLFYNLTI